MYAYNFKHMRNKYLKSFINSAISIIPIIAIIYTLSFVLSASGEPSLTNTEYVMLGIGAFIMISGLSFFQIGAQNSLIKIGEFMGASLSKQKKLIIVIIFAFLLGALITCAEPSIIIMSKQVNMNSVLLIASIACGVGIFVILGIIRIVTKKSLNVWFLTFYLIVFMLICILQADINNHPYLPFIFDAGGITTGSATVPFILALGAGVAMTRGGDKSRDSSFGLVGLASIGPIITMVILILAKPGGFSNYNVAELPAINPDYIDWNYIGNQLIRTLLPQEGGSLGSIIEVLLALAPILIIFFIYEAIYIKLSLKRIIYLINGTLVTFFGLTMFLCAVGSTMSPTGLKMGELISNWQDWIIIILAFGIGCVTILCEPAVHVLTTQIEEISNGELKKRTVLLSLSIGVGAAICLSMIRMLYGFSIMYYIVPGYLLSLVMMFVVPDLYTAVAFDSGGTASGPMAVSFVLPLIIGIFSVRTGQTSSVDFYESAFGVVAMVAMTPILSIQILGTTSKIKNVYALRVIRSQVHDERNDEIIHFC